MDRIAVLIPCYNEELSIAGVIADARAALPEATIYVYDNNSTDATVQRAKEAGAVIRYESRQGKGNVIRRMFREIDAECYVMVDGDDTYEMARAPEMVDLVLNHNADMVVGDRLSSTYFTENKRRFHNFGNSLVRAAINRLFQSEIRDIMTGFRAFSYQFVKLFPAISCGFEIETEMTIFSVNHHLQVENVVIEYRDRQEGSESKLNTYTDGCKVLRMIVRLYREYKPLQYFGFWAFLLLALSVGFVIPVLLDYAESGLVLRFPTLIVCGFAAIAALQSFFTGLILHHIAQHNRKDMELRLVTLHDVLANMKRNGS